MGWGAQFDPDYFLAETEDDGMVQELLRFQAHWQQVRAQSLHVQSLHVQSLRVQSLHVQSLQIQSPASRVAP
jgi:hypothetical protein